MSGKGYKEKFERKDAVELKVSPETTAEPDVEVVVPEASVSEAAAVTGAEPPASPASPSIPSESVFPDLGERYEVLAQIGSGGMGTVWKVRDLTLDRILAIKLLRSDMLKDETAVKRFEQEARLATDLTHMNIASIYGPGKDKTGQPFIVMNYIDGESLADIIAREGKLDEARAMDIFHQICDALAHSHMKGVIHRDIKPSNIIISKTAGGGDLVHIVDFGIAKSVYGDVQSTQALTRTEDTFGSPLYMSPEQILGEEVTERSDIYSLGCVLCEMLTGKPPFTEKNPVKLLVQHLTEIPDLPGLSLRLKALIMVCLQKRSTARPNNIDAIKEYLDRDYQDMSTAAIDRTYLNLLGLLPSIAACVVFVPILNAGATFAVKFSIAGLLIFYMSSLLLTLYVGNETSAIKTPVFKQLADSILVSIFIVLLQLQFHLISPFNWPPLMPIVVGLVAFPILLKVVQHYKVLERLSNWRKVSRVEKKVNKFRSLVGKLVFWLEGAIALCGVAPSVFSVTFLVLTLKDVANPQSISDFLFPLWMAIALYFVGVLCFWGPPTFLNFELSQQQMKKNLKSALKSATLIALAWGVLFAIPICILWEPAVSTYTRVYYARHMGSKTYGSLYRETAGLVQSPLADLARIDSVSGLVPDGPKSEDVRNVLLQVINDDASGVPLLKATAYQYLISNQYSDVDMEYMDKAFKQLRLDKRLRRKPYKSFKGEFVRLNAPLSAERVALNLAWKANRHNDTVRKGKFIAFLQSSGDLTKSERSELKYLSAEQNFPNKINASTVK